VVYDQDGITVAMRVAGLDRPKMLEQWFKMGEATDLDHFRDALKMGAVPMWNANYADDRGHIMLVFNGLVPRRKGHDYAYWSRVVPGDTSETMWTDYLTFDELPKSLDPPSGWNQNENEPPWTMTFPQLDRSKRRVRCANRRSASTDADAPLASDDHRGSEGELRPADRQKHSTRMELADKVLPDLLKAAAGTEAGRVLEKWDRQTDVDSRGGVLFQLFIDKSFQGTGGIADKLRVKYDPARPLESAYGLADPASAATALSVAANECKRLYGALDVRWGDVFRFASGRADLPGNGGAGGSGLFRTIAYTRHEGNRFYAAQGRRSCARLNSPQRSAHGACSATATPASRALPISKINCHSWCGSNCCRCCATNKLSKPASRNANGFEPDRYEDRRHRERSGHPAHRAGGRRPEIRWLHAQRWRRRPASLTRQAERRGGLRIDSHCLVHRRARRSPALRVVLDESLGQR
jgi:acyl-homoserine-lactone acylase